MANTGDSPWTENAAKAPMAPMASITSPVRSSRRV